jgi:hypothetical protein
MCPAGKENILLNRLSRNGGEITSRSKEGRLLRMMRNINKDSIRIINSFIPLESLRTYTGHDGNRKHQLLIKSGVKTLLFLTGFTMLFLLGIQTFSFATEDISREIGMLKEEIKTAQAKLDKAKPGQTLEAITLPVSIKNMQKILVSLNQKAGDVKSLSVPINNLNIGLKALEQATHNNDKAGARKALNDMTAALKALEAEVAKGDKEKTIQKSGAPSKVSSKVEGFLKEVEKAKSLDELRVVLKNKNFSKEELDQLKAEIKNPPYSVKLKNLEDQALSSARAKMDVETQKIIEQKQKEFKKRQDDELNLLNQQARTKLQIRRTSAQDKVRAERVLPPPDAPTTMVATRPVVKDPAKITSLIPQPLVIGAAFDQLHIIGENFGRSGRVTLSIGTKNTTLDTIAWHPDSIAVKMYSHLTEFFREEALNAMRDGEIIGRLWVHAAKNIATSEVRIHTSGWNLTLTPQITSISSEEIRPGQEITIEGKFFLAMARDSSVTFTFGSRNINGNIHHWEDSVIHVQLPSNVSGLNFTRGSLKVKNFQGFQADTPINFRPEKEQLTLIDPISHGDGGLGAFYDYGWSGTFTLRDFELINDWKVFEYWLNVYDGNCRYRDRPRTGTPYPRTVVEGSYGWNDCLRCLNFITIEGPRGTNYR